MYSQRHSTFGFISTTWSTILKRYKPYNNRGWVGVVGCLIIKISTQCRVYDLKIRWSYDCVTFIMGIHTPGKSLYIETRPRVWFQILPGNDRTNAYTIHHHKFNQSYFEFDEENVVRKLVLIPYYNKFNSKIDKSTIKLHSQWQKLQLSLGQLVAPKVVVMSDGKLGIMKTFIVQWFDGICPACVEQTTQIDGPPTEKDGFIK